MQKWWNIHIFDDTREAWIRLQRLQAVFSTGRNINFASQVRTEELQEKASRIDVTWKSLLILDFLIHRYSYTIFHYSARLVSWLKTVKFSLASSRLLGKIKTCIFLRSPLPCNFRLDAPRAIQTRVLISEKLLLDEGVTWGEHWIEQERNYKRTRLVKTPRCGTSQESKFKTFEAFLVLSVQRFTQKSSTSCVQS